MKTPQYISRSVASLLLVVMLHSHLCAAACATGFYSCCGNSNEVADCCKKKSCCEKSETKDRHSGCQKEHLTMFSTLGQYHFVKSISPKVYQPLVAMVPTIKIIQPVLTSELFFTYNGFHPPPPRENILALIQSFLI